MTFGRPRIRTVLLVVNLVIVAMPLFGMKALKLYESELVRQTEGSLIALGTYLVEHYRSELAEAFAGASVGGAAAAAATAPGAEPSFPPTFGQPVAPEFLSRYVKSEEPFEPIQATVDLSSERLRPPAPDAEPPRATVSPEASRAGAKLSTLLASAQRYSLTGVRIVDPNGIIVASSRGELGLSIGSREEIARALRGEAITLLRDRVSDNPEPALSGISRRGQVRVFVALPVVSAGRVLGVVVLSRTPLDLAKALYQSRYILLRYAALLVILALLVAALTASTISRPIRELIAQAHAVKVDPARAEREVARPGSREVEELSRAVAEMARTLNARADYIRTFAQNVSHEFKTPLGAILGAAELLRDHFATMSEAERERFLGMIEKDAGRMRRLVDRLLALARADVAAPAGEAVDVAALVQSVAERYRARGVPVEVVREADGSEPLAVRIPTETLDSVLANLLENARQHGGEGVRVRIELGRGSASESGAPEATLAVVDDGLGISAANQGRVFEPFFTTAREVGGTGLGLSIVRSLVVAHGGRVTLESEAGKGTKVMLAFPNVGVRAGE